MFLGKAVALGAVSLFAVACAPQYTTADDGVSGSAVTSTKGDGDTAQQSSPVVTQTAPTTTTTASPAATGLHCAGTEIACLDFAATTSVAPFQLTPLSGTCTVANGQLGCHEAMIQLTPPRVATSYDFDLDVMADIPATGTTASLTIAQMSLNQLNDNPGFWVSVDLEVDATGSRLVARTDHWGLHDNAAPEDQTLPFPVAGWHHLAFHLAKNSDASVTATMSFDGDVGFNVTKAFAFDPTQIAFEAGADALGEDTGTYSIDVKNVIVK